MVRIWIMRGNARTDRCETLNWKDKMNDGTVPVCANARFGA